MKVQIPNTRPTVELLGHDGNAFMILGRCRKAAQRAGWTKNQIAAFFDEAKSGDYDNLLRVTQTYFEVT